MCEIAPFCMECEYDEYNTTSCCVNKLNFAVRNLYQSLPVIGKYIDGYRCPHFTIKGKEKEKDMLKPGYNRMDCLEPLIIYEKEDWSEDEWKVLRTAFGFADEPNVTRIVAHTNVIECWNEKFD